MQVHKIHSVMALIKHKRLLPLSKATEAKIACLLRKSCYLLTSLFCHEQHLLHQQQRRCIIVSNPHQLSNTDALMSCICCYPYLTCNIGRLSSLHECRVNLRDFDRPWHPMQQPAQCLYTATIPRSQQKPPEPTSLTIAYPPYAPLFLTRYV